MANKRYFVRVRGKILGPFDVRTSSSSAIVAS